MSFDQETVFGRGQTYAGIGGQAPGATDGASIEGYRKRFADINYASGYGKALRSGLYCDCRIFRNAAGVNLLPMFVGSVKAGTETQIDGMTITGGQRGYVIDEWLPTAGVQANDLFWCCIQGPSQVLTGLATLPAVINLGAEVSAMTTSSSSQGTSAGRIKAADWTGATAVLGAEIAHFLGYAMSSCTSNNTNTALLVDLRLY